MSSQVMALAFDLPRRDISPLFLTSDKIEIYIRQDPDPVSRLKVGTSSSGISEGLLTNIRIEHQIATFAEYGSRLEHCTVPSLNNITGVSICNTKEACEFHNTRGSKWSIVVEDSHRRETDLFGSYTRSSPKSQQHDNRRR